VRGLLGNWQSYRDGGYTIIDEIPKGMELDMTDELQELTPEPKVENPTIELNIVPPPPKKSNKNLWIIASIAVVSIVCLCSILCIALIVTGVGKVMIEKAPVESVLDTFMKDMEAKNIESAYALFSPRSQRQIPITELEKLTQGNNYVVFEGYESIKVQNLNLTAAVNTNPDMPQGTVANVAGVVTYKDGFTGKLTAVLEKVDGEWRIFNFNVTVPPDKFQP
jgi:hypothetical protein